MDQAPGPTGGSALRQFDFLHGHVKIVGFVISGLEQLPSSDAIVQALLKIAPELLLSFFQQLDTAADPRGLSKIRQRSLGKLKGALRKLRPLGRPGVELAWEVPGDWPSIERLHREFVHLMQALDQDLSMDSAAEAVKWLRLALDGDQSAKDFIQDHAPSFPENPLHLDAGQREAFFASLATIKRPKSSVTSFGTCALCAKYGVSRQLAQREIRVARLATSADRIKRRNHRPTN